MILCDSPAVVALMLACIQAVGNVSACLSRRAVCMMPRMVMCLLACKGHRISWLTYYVRTLVALHQAVTVFNKRTLGLRQSQPDEWS